MSKSYQQTNPTNLITDNYSKTAITQNTTLSNNICKKSAAKE